MIERDERDGIFVLRFAHGKASALDLELVEALGRHCDEIEASDARALVLTGTGGIFSAGVDLFRILRDGEAYVRRFLPALEEAFRKLFVLGKPVVAAVNGHAIAGGGVLTCTADYRIMARGTGRIGVPELLVGVPFPTLALETVRFALPSQHVQSLVYTGRTVEPEEALRVGFVDEVVEPEALLERALAVARQFAEIPPAAFRLTKTTLRRAAVARVEEASDGPEVLAAWCAPETHERIRAYLERTVGKGREARP